MVVNTSGPRVIHGAAVQVGSEVHIENALQQQVSLAASGFEKLKIILCSLMECSIQTLGIFALADHQFTDELKPTVKPVLTSPAKTRGSPLPISSLAAPGGPGGGINANAALPHRRHKSRYMPMHHHKRMITQDLSITPSPPQGQCAARAANARVRRVFPSLPIRPWVH